MERMQGPYGDETEPAANQRRDEPMPASHGEDPDQAAVARNEEHAAARSADTQPPGAEPAEGSRPAMGPDEPGLPAEDTGPGKAVRDMMPGPGPQGDVPDAPAVQVAAAKDPAADDDPPGPVRYVGNAVPGKPDGEVDTRQ